MYVTRTVGIWMAMSTFRSGLASVRNKKEPTTSTVAGGSKSRVGVAPGFRPQPLTGRPFTFTVLDVTFCRRLHDGAVIIR